MSEANDRSGAQAGVPPLQLELPSAALEEKQVQPDEAVRGHHQLYEHVPVGYLALGERTRISSGNARGARLLGVPRAELIGQRLSDFLLPEDRDAFHHFWVEAAKGVEGAACEVWLWGPERAPRRVRIEAFPGRHGDRAGEVHVSLVDVTPAKPLDAREHALGAGAREALLLDQRLLAERAPLVLWVFDVRRRRLRYVSPHVERVLGVSAEELSRADLGRLASIMRDVDRRQLERSIEQLRAAPDGTVTQAEYQFRHVNGRRCWFAARETVLTRGPDGSVECILGALLDVTESREANQRAVQHSQEAALLEERERRRLATALHDGPGQLLPLARTKLHLLAGLTDPLRREALIADIDALLRDTSRALAGLAQSLRPPTVREVGLGPALRALAVEIRERHGVRVLVEDGPTDAPPPPALGEALVRAVRELLVNVARHADVDKARVVVSQGDGCLELVVEDHGSGFDSARMRSGGTGLSSIREQLGYLGGEMDVRSEPGRGTRVRLRAPLAMTSRAPSEVSS